MDGWMNELTIDGWISGCVGEWYRVDQKCFTKSKDRVTTLKPNGSEASEREICRGKTSTVLLQLGNSN